MFKPNLIYSQICIVYLSVWLPHNQFWAILERAARLKAFLYIRPKGHWEPRKEIGSLGLVEHLVAFEWATFRFCLDKF